MTMTDPIADMLTRIRNANIAIHDDVRDAVVEAQGGAGQDPRAEGYIEGFEVADDPKRPGDKLDDHDEVHARPQAHDLRHQARVQARPARLHRGRTTCPACSAAWASPSSRPTRVS